MIHQFDFRFFMLLLDLDELPGLLRGRVWSTRRLSLCRFNQAEHLQEFLGDHPDSLRDRVRLAQKKLGLRVSEGPVRLLTQLSYLGFAMNPVSFFYCYDAEGDRVESIIAEVNNTPWGEQHLYGVCGEEWDRGDSLSQPSGIRSPRIKKEFHVSPFMKLDMEYRMAFSLPSDTLGVKIENHAIGEIPPEQRSPDSTQASRKNKWMDVTMSLQRKPWKAKTLYGLLIKYPAISFQVVAGIYWQALRLYLKKIPFIPHPNRTTAETGSPLSRGKLSPSSIQLPEERAL